MNRVVVLDTSAIFAHLEDEEGSDEVEQLLLDADRGESTVFVSFVSLTEVRYVLMQEQDVPSADRAVAIVKSWPMRWVHSDEELCMTAARLKAFHRISLADSFVAATAKTLSAELMHKDPEFEALTDEIVLSALPYKG